MNIQSECLVCLISQIEKAFKNLNIQYSNDELVEVQKHLMHKLAVISEKGMPYYSQALYQGLAEVLGKIDPYQEIKRQSNELALSLGIEVKELLRQAENPFLMSIAIAILGNTLDYGTAHTIDLRRDIQNFHLNQLAINHYDDFVIDFEMATKILIIGDNAGEAVLDGIMLKYMHRMYPEKQFFYAVRGGPAINDVTMDDIASTDIPTFCTVVEGSASPGVIYSQASREFQAIFDNADIILSKGQGNFESLDNIPIPHGKIYFLLKAKCQLVANLFHVPLGSLIFYRRTNILDLQPKKDKNITEKFTFDLSGSKGH